MRRQRSANRKVAKRLARADMSPSLRAHAIGLAAVAAALELPVDGFDSDLAALIAQGAAAIAPHPARLAA
jgi:hypothetical protein